MLNLSRDMIKDLIGKAYEEGWSGCLELKSDYVEGVVDKLMREQTPSNSVVTVSAAPSQSISTTSINAISELSTSFTPGYYSYFGHIGASETVFVNDPGEEAL